MSPTPQDPSGGGSLHKRAAELKAQMEAKQTEATGAVEETTGPQPGQTYTLKEGDTLQTIAEQVDQEPADIWYHDNNEKLHALRSSPEDLQPGDEIFIPGEEDQTGPVGQGDYVVKQGDCMASIAVDSGHFWETIWNDPANAELKEVRGDPYVLLPGDRVTIPELTPKTESGESEARHRFVRKGAPEKLIIRFLVNGEPRDNEAYVLEIDGKSFEGTTDSDGVVSIAIPPNAEEGKITFTESGDEYDLDLGHLDPITEVIGLQKRLGNLGFFHGPEDGEMSEELEQAIRQFQKEHDLESTGNLDQATREKIGEAHDGH